MSDSSEMVNYLLGRVRDLEAQVRDLTEQLKSNSKKMRRYRSGMREDAEPASYVYFIGAGETTIKIGFSRNPWSRLADLQNSSPEELRLLGIVRGEAADEKNWHEQWKHLRLHGEWFRADADLLKAIDVATNHSTTDPTDATVVATPATTVVATVAPTVTLFPSQTLPISRDHKKNKYSSPLADFLTETWPEKPLTEQQEAAWRASCPGIDLLAAARSARAWQLEDMARRQRPRALQFLGNWFRNEQQRLRAMPTRPGAASLHITPEAKRDHAVPGRKML